MHWDYHNDSHFGRHVAFAVVIVLGVAAAVYFGAASPVKAKKDAVATAAVAASTSTPVLVAKPAEKPAVKETKPATKPAEKNPPAPTKKGDKPKKSSLEFGEPRMLART